MLLQEGKDLSAEDGPVITISLVVMAKLVAGLLAPVDHAGPVVVFLEADLFCFDFWLPFAFFVLFEDFLLALEWDSFFVFSFFLFRTGQSVFDSLFVVTFFDFAEFVVVALYENEKNRKKDRDEFFRDHY